MKNIRKQGKTYCRMLNYLKPCQNKKGQKFVSAASKMVSFSQLPAVKKTTNFGEAETNFRPFLFYVTALGRL